jgi:N,N-dimethylformamidase beta subunit-like protein
MLIGYVSDEHYLALSDVAVELDGNITGRSTASGAIHADVEPGRHRITLAKSGFGSKHVEIDLPGPHRFRLLSDALAGYVWPKWTVAGQTGELRIHSTSAYRAELWRYDRTKEMVRPLGWYDEHGPRAMAQILPDADVAAVGAGWNTHGFTSPAHVPRLQAPYRSGLHYVHVHNESGEFTSFPWVVAPERPQARIAVLASTNTWNAYNNFGGRSNYINADRLPDTPTVNARLDLRRYVEGNQATQDAPNGTYDPLSFDRPDPACAVDPAEQVTDPAGGRLASTLAPGLWRLLGWLTREGYGHDLYADRQLDDGTLDLDSYRVLVLDSHPEYWSRNAYERVKAWVHERGGKLMYLGGNGIDCEVEFDGDGALRFKTQHVGGTDFESRFHRTVEPQTRLLGVTYTPPGEGTAAPYATLAADHWVFTGTGLTEGARFGVASLHERIPGGASGHETDKRTANSPAGTVLLAKGTNAGGGGAEMVYYETPSGGAVFSAGSITYINSLLVDTELSRITANVLDRFLEK